MISPVKDLIRSIYKELSGKELDDPVGDDIYHIEAGKLQSVFSKLEQLVIAEDNNKRLEIESQAQELTEIRHSLTTLQSEFESKFEKNKVISFNIPPAKGNLEIKDDDIDSIKSFRPESDDDSDDVRRKEEELKARKRQQQSHSTHQHAPNRKCCHNHSHNHLFMDTHQQHYGF